jgi:nucleoside transporter
MNIRIIQIALMFFIKYYIVGAIYTTMALVLGSHGMGSYIGVAYSVGGFAALFASMLLGELADRFMVPNKLLFFCHLVSALALWEIPGQILTGHAWAFLWLLAVYTTFGDATLSLCTRIAFHALQDNVQYYSVTRAFGTAGFMCAGLVTGFSGLSSSVRTFEIGAVVSVGLAVYALTLPKTPAAGRRGPFSWRDLIGWDAFVLLRERNFLVFILIAVAIFFPMSAYNAYLPVYLKDNGITNVGGLMTLAQMTEIVMMFSLAFFIRWLGIRNILAVACFCWFLILLAFAVGDRFLFALIVLGILLHGAGWDFFYASSEVYINSKAKEELKARAQALLRAATFGLGTIFGSLASGALYNSMQSLKPATPDHWPLFWGLICTVPLFLMVMVLAFFREGASAVRRPEKLLSVPLEA